MYSLSIKHSSPEAFLHKIADSQKLKVQDNKVALSPALAKGYFKAFRLSNGCEFLVSDYDLKEDFHLHKFSLSTEFFVLRFDEVTHSDKSVIMVGKKFATTGELENHSLVFVTSLIDFAFIAPKRSHVKSLEIFIPAHWLDKQFGLQDGKERLSNYMDFKNRKGLENFATPDLVRQFKQIIFKCRHHEEKSMREDVNSLLQDFINNLTRRLIEDLNVKKVKIVNDEVKRLLEVKNYLVKDLSLLPAFPDLKKVAAMSGTTLKTKFKKMYGVTMYEYFQHMRMEKARILLLSFKYSISQVGRQLGYSNLSHFATAFKKEFGQLPKSYMQLHKSLST